MGMVPELHPDVHGVQKKIQMTNFTMTNNMSSMKYALKTVPGLADVGVPHGGGDDSRTQPRCLEGVRKKFQMTYFSLTNKTSFMKYALKSVPGLADAGVPHGDGDGPQSSTQMSEGSGKNFK